MNLSSSYFVLFLQQTLLLNFPYTGHSNQRTILTQQFLAFIYKISHIFTRIVRMPDLTSIAALCTIFQQLPQLRLLESLKTPLSFDSAIKRRCKNRGNGSLLSRSGHWGPRCLTTPRGQILLLSQICNPVKHFFENIMSCKDISTYLSLFWKWKLSPSASAAVVSSISRVQTSLMKFQNPDHQSEAMPIFYSDCDWQAGHSLERI